jgi:AraC family transcriptional regulator
MSYFSAMRVAAYGDIAAMPPHRHDTAVICLPLGGAYVERTRDRETEHGLGDFLFCPAGEEHSQLFPAGRVVKLLVTPSAIAHDYLAQHVRLDQAPFARGRAFEALAVRLARELGGGDLQSALIAEGIGLEILGLFARAEAREAPAPAWLRAARDFVRANACAAIRLAEVAAHVGRAAPRLAAAYRRAFGCTIGEDARALRLRRAASLLASTREPIAAIASDCGYFDQAHFTRAFRRAYGVTPGAYRGSFH